MLGYRGIAITPETLRSQVYIPAKGGALSVELVARARRMGLLVYPLQPAIADLLLELNAGNPVLVFQNLGFDWWPQWHFAVAIGYDLDKQTIVLRSGSEANYSIDLQLFVTTWQRAAGWAVVIMPPNQLPVTAAATGFLQSASELEQIGKTKEAQSAYDAALVRWSDHPVALIGSGNTAFALGNYEAASAQFIKYINVDPNSPVGWNNLAYSLQKLGCSTAAVQAVKCANTLSPNSSQYRSSLEDILAAINADNREAYCVIPNCPL